MLNVVFNELRMLHGRSDATRKKGDWILSAAATSLLVLSHNGFVPLSVASDDDGVLMVENALKRYFQ